MTVTAKTLIQARYAGVVDTTEYTVPAATKAIIDKFTATNNDASPRTVTVNLVASGGSPGASNRITSALSIPAGASVDLPEMKNHVLETGAFISVVASVATMVVIRASGREVT